MLKPVVKRKVPKLPLVVLSKLKSVFEVVEIDPVVLRLNEAPPLNNWKSLPFILKMEPSTRVNPPLVALPNNTFDEPPVVDSKIVFAVVVVILNQRKVLPAPVNV